MKAISEWLLTNNAHVCNLTQLMYILTMVDTAEHPIRLGGQTQLDVIVQQYPYELVADAGSLQEAFANFIPPESIGAVLVDDGESRKTLTITGERKIDIEGCVETGLSFVTVGDGDPDHPYRQSLEGDRRRAVRAFMETEGFRDHINRVIEETADQIAIGRHFFVYGVALGVKMRQGARKGGVIVEGLGSTLTT